jgi:hypothetical protein
MVGVIRDISIKMEVIIIGIVALVAIAVFGIGTLVNNAVYTQARDSEITRVLADPNSIITISRIGDAPCAAGCKERRYTVTNNLRTMNVSVGGWCMSEILMPGQSYTRDCTEELSGEQNERCFSVSVIKQPLHEIAIDHPICYR